MMMSQPSREDPPSDNEQGNSTKDCDSIVSDNEIKVQGSCSLSLDDTSAGTPNTQGSQSTQGSSPASTQTSCPPHVKSDSSPQHRRRQYRISRSGEERIEEVLNKKFDGMHQRNEGLEKLGAYVLGDEARAIPSIESASPSLSEISHQEEYEDEEISLELSVSQSLESSQSASTSSPMARKSSTEEQMNRWIREVNIAVGREPPPELQEIAKEEEKEKENLQVNDVPVEPVEIPSTASPPVSLPEILVQESPLQDRIPEEEAPIITSENAITNDTLRLALFMQNQQENPAFRFTPASRQTNPLSPRFMENTQDDDVALFAGWDDNKPPQTNKELFFCPDFNLEIKTKAILDEPKTENAHQEVHQEDASTIISSMTTKSKYRKNNSRLIMASIEGKYRNLQAHLTTESVEEEEEEEANEDEMEAEAIEKSRCRVHPAVRRTTNTLGSPVRKMVSCVMESREAFREEYNTRDHFSLGMLSMQSSGILRSNSWSTTDSYESEISGKYQPKGKGCGMFMCD